MSAYRYDSAPKKPIRRAIDDGVAAVTRAARSLRASATKSARSAKTRIVLGKDRAKTRVVAAKATIKQKTQSATTRARVATRGMKARVGNAWDALTHDSAGDCAPSCATPRKSAVAARRP